MSFFSHSPYRERCILFFWGLLFTKCFVVEFLVRTYEAPVASWFYVWGLSLSMATIATFLSLRLRASQGSTDTFDPRLVRIWLSSLALALAGSTLFAMIPQLELARGTLWLGLIAAGAHTLQAQHTTRTADWFSALGWWATLIALATLPSTPGLLLTGIAISTFSLLPLGSRLIFAWIGARQALRSLNANNKAIQSP